MYTSAFFSQAHMKMFVVTVHVTLCPYLGSNFLKLKRADMSIVTVILMTSVGNFLCSEVIQYEGNYSYVDIFYTYGL